MRCPETDKISYHSKTEAKTNMDRMRGSHKRKYNGELKFNSIYKCKHCRLFHLTTHKKRIIQPVIGRSTKNGDY